MFDGKCLFSSPFGRFWCAIRAALVLALLTLAAQPALAAPGDSGAAPADASVAVMQPLQIVKMKDLHFGQFAASTTIGTVVVSATNGTCTTTGGIYHIGGCQAAEFGGMGASNGLIRVRVRNLVNLTGPGTAMVLSGMTVDASPDLTPNGNGNNGRYRIATASGIFAFNVGGTLTVNANQAPGVYTGSFDVVVDYF